MKKILSAMALVACAFTPSALAADEHAKVLIDAASNLATANWKISSADWGGKGAPAWTVQLRTFMAAARKAFRSSTWTMAR